MASVQKPYLTFLEAFDIVGRQMFGDAWVGFEEINAQWWPVTRKEIEILEPPWVRTGETPVLTPVSTREKPTAPGKHKPRRAKREKVMKIHHEAHATQDRPSPETAEKMKKKDRAPHWPVPNSDEYRDYYGAFHRRADVITMIREIMSDWRVQWWFRDVLTGQRQKMDPDHWHPRNARKFHLNSITNTVDLGSTATPRSGEIEIDRKGFNKALGAAIQPKGKRQEVALSRGRKTDSESQRQAILNEYDAMMDRGEVFYEYGGLSKAVKAIAKKFSAYKQDSIRRIIQPSHNERKRSAELVAQK